MFFGTHHIWLYSMCTYVQMQTSEYELLTHLKYILMSLESSLSSFMGQEHWYL